MWGKALRHSLEGRGPVHLLQLLMLLGDGGGTAKALGLEVLTDLSDGGVVKNLSV
jgi:hypothetical protein